jgi:hypothetical protein
MSKNKAHKRHKPGKSQSQPQGRGRRFTEKPLVSYTESQATPIRVVHSTQLRDAVNAVRKFFNPSATPFDWTPRGPQIGGPSARIPLTT